MMFMAMLKKEWTESFRSFKLMSVIIVFAILGIMSPFIALLTPQILESALQEEFAGFVFPEPTAHDAFVQFYSNINQMGLIIFVILFGSILTNEFSRGTLVNLLTKGLRRDVVIHVKALFVLVVWTVSYAVAAVLTYFYTIYYWDEPLYQLFGALVTTWIFGVFIISIIFLASVLFRNFIAVLSSVVVLLVVFFLLSIHPDVAEWLPTYLNGHNVEMLKDAKPFSDMWPAIGMTVGLSIVFYVLTILRFRRMEV